MGGTTLCKHGALQRHQLIGTTHTKNKVNIQKISRLKKSRMGKKKKKYTVYTYIFSFERIFTPCIFTPPTGDVISWHLEQHSLPLKHNILTLIFFFSFLTVHHMAQPGNELPMLDVVHLFSHQISCHVKRRWIVDANNMLSFFVFVPNGLNAFAFCFSLWDRNLLIIAGYSC